MESYTRRATKAFSFLWSILTLVVVVMGVLVGAITEPMPDWFAIMFPFVTAIGAGACGFLHGVTLAAARQLDKQAQDEEEVGQ